jgi:hypothetical protein
MRSEPELELVGVVRPGRERGGGCLVDPQVLRGRYPRQDGRRISSMDARWLSASPSSRSSLFSR